MAMQVVPGVPGHLNYENTTGGRAIQNAGYNAMFGPLAAGSPEAGNVAAILGAAPVVIPPPVLPPTTNLLPHVPATQQMLRDFLDYCAPVPGVPAVAATPAIEANVVTATTAYIRMVCELTNRHPPAQNLAANHGRVAYLDHTFWDPPPGFEGNVNLLLVRAFQIPYIIGRVAWLNANGFTAARIRALRHLLIHVVDHDPARGGGVNDPWSSLIVITPAARTIDFLDSYQPSRNTIHQLRTIGYILDILAKQAQGIPLNPAIMQPGWIEMHEWKMRRVAPRRAMVLAAGLNHTASQVWTCSNAAHIVFGYNLFKNEPAGVPRPVLLRQKAEVIVADLFRGSFTNVIGAPGYRPRIDREFTMLKRQPRGAKSFEVLHPRALKRFDRDDIARWNADGVYIGHNAPWLVLNIMRGGNAAMMFYNAPYNGYFPAIHGNSRIAVRCYIEHQDLLNGLGQIPINGYPFPDNY